MLAEAVRARGAAVVVRAVASSAEAESGGEAAEETNLRVEGELT